MHEKKCSRVEHNVCLYLLKVKKHFGEKLINLAWKTYLGQLILDNCLREIIWRVIIRGVIIRGTVIQAPTARGPIFLGANMSGGWLPRRQLSWGEIVWEALFLGKNCPGAIVRGGIVLEPKNLYLKRRTFFYMGK